MTSPEFVDNPVSDTLFYPWGRVRLSQGIRALGLEPAQLPHGEIPPFSTNSFVADPSPFYPQIHIALFTQDERTTQSGQVSLDNRTMSRGLQINVQVPPNELLVDTEKKIEVIATILDEVGHHEAIFDYRQDRPKDDTLLERIKDFWFSMRTKHEPPPTARELDYRLNRDDFNDWVMRDLVTTFLGVPPSEEPDLQSAY